MICLYGDAKYSNVTPSNPLQNQGKKHSKSHITIPLRGTNSKYCLFTQDHHTGNNVYYILQSTGALEFRCHAKQCEPLWNAKKFEFKNTLKQKKMMLTNEEKAMCKKILGFGGPTPILENDILIRKHKKWEPEKIQKQLTQDEIAEMVRKVKREDSEEDCLEDVLSLMKKPKKENQKSDFFV